MTVIQPVNLPRRLKLTVEQFLMLEDSGAFEGNAKTELIEGTIYAMNAQFVAHAVAKSRLARRLGNALEAMGSRLDAVVEGTVAMPPNSAPEPDIALAEVTTGERAFIPLEALALVVEVSDASIGFDLGEKMDMYARHRVPEYWVLDVTSGTMHQLWHPTAEGYAESRSVKVGDPIESATISGLIVESDRLI
jgi:Uma2 family endonuclease